MWWVSIGTVFANAGYCFFIHTLRTSERCGKNTMFFFRTPSFYNHVLFCDLDFCYKRRMHRQNGPKKSQNAVDTVDTVDTGHS